MLRRPTLKLLYVTPEQLVNGARLMDALRHLNGLGLLSRFVIDEAHCVSAWQAPTCCTIEDGSLRRSSRFQATIDAHAFNLADLALPTVTGSYRGHDFRKDYKELGCLREAYPNVPILALTGALHAGRGDSCDVFGRGLPYQRYVMDRPSVRG